MTTWLRRIFGGGGVVSAQTTGTPKPSATMDDLDARIARMERELIASSLASAPNTIQSFPKESQSGKVKHVFDDKHPLAQVLSLYVMKKRNARFKWPNAVIADAVVDAGYRAQSMSPFLTIMTRQGVVKRTGKGKYEWIGFRPVDPPPCLQVTRLPKCPKPINADIVLHAIANSTDGLTFGQLMVAFPKATHSQMNGALTSLQRKNKIIRIDGRYWAWADIERRTTLVRTHAPNNAH